MIRLMLFFLFICLCLNFGNKVVILMLLSFWGNMVVRGVLVLFLLGLFWGEDFFDLLLFDLIFFGINDGGGISLRFFLSLSL